MDRPECDVCDAEHLNVPDGWTCETCVEYMRALQMDKKTLRALLRLERKRLMRERYERSA